MDFLRGFIPKNPINSSTQSNIQKALKELLEKFLKNYTLYSQLILIENKETEFLKKKKQQIYLQKYKLSKIKSFKKKYGDDAEIPDFPEPPEFNSNTDIVSEYCKYMFKLGFKPMYPRGKFEPKIPTEINAYIYGYGFRDSPYDPYCVYYISAYRGNIIASKERRFSDFAKLNKAIKKFLPKDCPFPPPSSKIGKRNLTPEFISARMDILNKYISIIIKIKDLQYNEDFLRFFGLLQCKNPTDEQIFKKAFKKTKWDLCNWDYIVYDTPEEAMTKLITKEVYHAVENDIENALPEGDGPKKASRKVAFRSISTTVSKGIPPAWNEAYEAGLKLRASLESSLANVIELTIEKKDEYNEKFKNLILDNITPVKDGLGKAISAAFEPLASILVKPFAPLVKAFNLKIENRLLDAFFNNNPKSIDDSLEILEKTHSNLKKKLQENNLDIALSSISDKLKGEISIQELGEFFKPIGSLNKVIENLVILITPTHWEKVFKVLVEYKQKLEQNENGNIFGILNEMEYKVLNEIYWESYYIESCIWKVRSNLNDKNLSLLSETSFDIGYKIKDHLFMNVMKKMTFKFSDYVWGWTMTLNDNRNWDEKIKDAFEKAYKAARHKFVKEVGCVILEGFDILIQNVIVNNVTKMLDSVLNPLIESIESGITENIKPMIDLKSMINDDIHEILDTTIIDILKKQGKYLANILDNEVNECNE
jgi:hypothetical protein